MTEELKQAAQAALEALKNVTDYDQINAARRALERALTQRPAALAGEAFESVLIDGVAYDLQAPVAAELLRLHLELQALPTQLAQNDAFFVLDDEAKAMIVNSHHYTPENIRALIEQLKSFADPTKTNQADWDNLDWRGFCNVLWRVMMGLSCDLPTQPAAQATPDHAAEIARLKAVIDQLERREILAVAHQATPEPVGVPVGTVECYQIRGEDVVLGYLPRPLPVGTKLYTRPAQTEQQPVASAPVADERAAKLDAECNSLAHQLNASNERNGMLRAALSDCSAELFAQCGDQSRAMSYVNAARASLPAPQQATPEPVGEPVAAWRWFNSNGDQVTNWLDFKAAQKANVEAQVAEAGGRIEYAYTRPAPGVPEDSALLDYLDTLAARPAGSDLHCFGGRVVLYVRTGIGSQIEASGAGTAREAIRAALAAAQAKGEQP